MTSTAHSRTIFALAIALQFLVVEATFAKSGSSSSSSGSSSRSSGPSSSPSRPSTPSAPSTVPSRPSGTPSTVPSTPPSGGGGSYIRGGGSGSVPPTGGGGGPWGNSGGSPRGGFGGNQQQFRGQDGQVQAPPGKAPALKPGLSTGTKVAIGAGVVGTGVVAGSAVHAATSAESERQKTSTRPVHSYAYQQQTPAERAREKSPAPSYLYGPSPSRMTSSGGWLEPKFSNLVFSPFYYYVPFNVWHVSPSRSQVQNGTTYSSSTHYVAAAPSGVHDSISSLRDNSPESREGVKPYQGGDVGSSEVNQLPEWIQASLRLMHTKQKTMMPSDPVVRVSKVTDQEFDNKIKALTEEMMKIHAEIAVKRGYADAVVEINRLRYRMEVVERDRAVANEALVRTLGEIKGYVAEVQRFEGEKQRIQTESWLCSNLSLLCEYFASEPIEAAADALVKIGSRETSVRSIKLQILDRDSDIARMNDQIKALDASIPNSQPREDLTLRNDSFQLQRQLGEKSAQLKALEGFVRWNAKEVKLKPKTLEECPAENMYVFRFVNSISTHHPLFSDTVEVELVPSHEAELVVCLTSGNKLKSVHIIQNDQELYTTTLARDEAGAINYLGITNEKSVDVEEHFWTYNDQGNVAYGQKFVHGDNLFGIRTEFKIQPRKQDVQ